MDSFLDSISISNSEIKTQSDMEIKTELDEIDSEIDLDSKDPSLFLDFETEKTSKKKPEKKKKKHQMRKACKRDCRYKCHLDINETQRCKIHEEFWKGSPNHPRKWQFIAKHTNVLDIAKSTTAWKSKRTKSRQYYLTVDKKKIRVCKTMFLSTLGIGESCVETALRKAAEGLESAEDMRGKHSKRPNKVSEVVRNGIREHINMFPRMKMINGEEFLEEGLCVSKMYTFYKEWMGKQTITKIGTERQYRDMFNSEFNLNFFKWKKDQCDFCTEWTLMDPKEKAKLQEVYNTHLANKDFVRDLKDQEKVEASKDKTLCVACFDMQKVFNVPRGEASVFYYNRSLSLYNFTVFDCVQYQGYAYVWSEDVAREGSNEIATCLLKFVEKKVQEGTKEFRLYSDNYNCRNGNPYIFSILYLAAVKYEVKITLRFLENGHFQHEGDVMRALIERKSKGQNIYAPEEWYEFIKRARDGAKAYQVTQISQDDILDMQTLVDCQNWTVDVDGKDISWSSVREVKMNHEFSSTLDFKYSFQEDSNFISVTNNVEEVDLNSFILGKAYQSRLPIERAKLQDLLSLCKNNTIPVRYHNFYQSLIAENEVDAEIGIMQD